jgi:hypothetical protein
MEKRRYFALVVLAALSLLSCRTFAVATAPPREPQAPDASTLASESALLSALEAGDYDRLPELLESLTRSALERPRDGRIHLALGLAHLWAVSEKDRAPRPSPRLTEHVVLSRHHLDSAYALLPKDARVHGWSAGAQLASATLLDDQAARRAGYFEMQEAVAEFPEFNLFSRSYVLSRLRADDPKFERDVVGSMFDLMDRCFGRAGSWEERRERLRRALSTRPGPADPKRVCLPSPKAPHNVEGFFLHLGDVLAKAGRIDDARQAYSLARLAPESERWPHRAALDERIATLEARSPLLRAAKNGEGMMVVSALSCSGCHQR